MDISAVFTPVGQDLTQNVFPTDIVYHRAGAQVYDPLSGVVTGGTTDYAIKVGVLSRSRTEEGGSGEKYEISIWVTHAASGLPFLPTTADSFTYDGTVWKVVEVPPTYSSTSLIASKIIARAS